MKNMIEYIYECGCRRPDFITDHVNGSKSTITKLCPDHRDRIKNKIFQCAECKSEYIASKMANPGIDIDGNTITVCPECRKTRNNRIALDWHRRAKEKGTKPAAWVKKDDQSGYAVGWDKEPLAIRLLKKKFPPMPKPCFSEECRAVIEKYR